MEGRLPEHPHPLEVAPRLGEEPDKGPAGALSPQRRPAEASPLPPKHSKRLSSSRQTAGYSEAREEVTTTRNGVGGASAFFQQPQGTSIHFRKTKQNPPRSRIFLLRERGWGGPFLGPAGCALGRVPERGDGAPHPTPGVPWAPPTSPAIYEAAPLGTQLPVPSGDPALSQASCC